MNTNKWQNKISTLYTRPEPWLTVIKHSGKGSISYSNIVQWQPYITVIKHSYSNIVQWQPYITVIKHSYSNIVQWQPYITVIKHYYSNIVQWQPYITVCSVWIVCFNIWQLLDKSYSKFNVEKGKFIARISACSKHGSYPVDENDFSKSL